MNKSRSVPPLIEVPLAKEPELCTLTRRVSYHLWIRPRSRSPAWYTAVPGLFSTSYLRTIRSTYLLAFKLIHLLKATDYVGKATSKHGDGIIAVNPGKRRPISVPACF